MVIVGLSGTNGAGKDTVGYMLAERHGYLFVSLTDMLRTEAKKRNLPVARKVLRSISAEWRRKHGLGVLIDKAVNLYNQQKEKPTGLVVASLRNLGEVDKIHALNGMVVWVDADPKIRYERVQANKALRGRTAEDEKTFEEFVAEEQAEMHSSGDEAMLSMSTVKAQADIMLENNGNDQKAFMDEAEAALRPYLTRQVASHA